MKSPSLIGKATRVLAIVFITVLAIGIVGYMWQENRPEPHGEQRLAMEQYLEKKYGQDFVVEKPRYEESGFGVDGTWDSTASPAKDNELTFRVGATKKLDYFSDQFVAAMWSKEQTDKIRPDVESIYGRSTTTEVAAKITFSGDLVRDATLTSPTYDEAKNNYADRGFYYEYTVKAPFGADPSSEAEKIYQLIEISRRGGLKKVGVHYTEEKSGDEWICILESSDTVLMKDATEIKNCIQNKVKLTD